jgi:hypothetical protein
MESTSVFFSAFFFCFLVIFGSFFLLNLILAVIIEAYMKIDLKEKNKEEQKKEQEANKRQRKLDALKTMLRMMNISQQKKQFIEHAGLKYRWSFFDLVFEIVRVEKYEKVMK